jgi:UDPglucose 6-dehydrogenase
MGAGSEIMKRQSAAVIGNGFVGGSLTTVLSERGIDVYVYDKAHMLAAGGKYPKRTQVTLNVTDLIDACESVIAGFSKVYFVCLPTPMQEDGSADLSIVEGVLEELAKRMGERIAVIKSTVPPGSTEAWNKRFAETGLRIIFNPEFLTERNALDDMRNQNRIILGGPRPWINKVKRLYEVAFPNIPIIKTSSTTAEMVKYITNVHLAVKVSLANEFYQICEALDAQGANIDYDKCIEYAQYDARLGKSHWAVPGPMPDDITGEPAYGFAGSCFIKDLNALIHLARKIGVDPKTMEGAWCKNLEVRPQKDWLRLIGRAVSEKK